jgi:DNA-binding CsgD family transcriptional regulator
LAERLGQRDLKVLQQCVAELYELDGLDGFRTRVVRALPVVVPGDFSVYAELDMRRGKVTWNADALKSFRLRDAPDVFAAHMGDLPLFKSYRRGAGSAVKITDSLTQRQFHDTAIYNEFYRPVGVEYHIAKGLPGPAELVTAVGIVRKCRDFSERDRLVLNLLRPHLNQSYRNAMTMSRMDCELTLLRDAVEVLDQGVVVLASDGRIAGMSGRARRWLAEYFGEPRGMMLPETLRRWMSRCDAELASHDDAMAAREPLRVTREGRQLSVRLVSHGDRRVLLLSETHSAPRPAVLESLGLSRREAEVLAWVAEGKTNAEIATSLAASVRTVDKHLEHVFRKLGVETRTAAAARALSVLRT